MSQVIEKIDLNRMGGPLFSGREKGRLITLSWNVDQY